MRDNADLQDRTQQMEHLILQLQGETDTIGRCETRHRLLPSNLLIST